MIVEAVIAVVVGTIFSAVAVSASSAIAASKGGQKRRTAKTQLKSVNEKFSDRKQKAKIIREHKRQRTALKWGIRPLMLKMECVKYKVDTYNGKFASILGNNEASLSRFKNRKLKRYKVRKETANIYSLKRDGKCFGECKSPLNRLRLHFINSFISKETDVFKTNGFIGAVEQNVGDGGSYTLSAFNYGGKDEYNVSNRIYAPSNYSEHGFDANDLFGQALNENLNTLNSFGNYTRFRVDCPISSGKQNIAFAVGERNGAAAKNKVFATGKLASLATTCARWDESFDQVRLVDESVQEPVSILSKVQFAEYLKKYLKSPTGQKAMATIKNLDNEQFSKIKESLNTFAQKNGDWTINNSDKIDEYVVTH